MSAVLDPKLVSLLQKLEADGLSDLKSLLIPALIAEVEVLSPDVAKSIEVVLFGALQGTIQSAFEGLLAKIPAPPAP